MVGRGREPFGLTHAFRRLELVAPCPGDVDFQGNIKIGDFGLACLLAHDEERKTTICGTPNYIAPEVLGGSSVGHSFEVDIWSLGVMIYAMIVGRPPFETSDVKSTYKRIKQNAYAFPSALELSNEAKVIGALRRRHPPPCSLQPAFRSPFPPSRPSSRTSCGPSPT